MTQHTKTIFVIMMLIFLETTSGASAQEANATAPAKPNLLLMFVDNVGYGDLGCYGNKQVKTPNIDQLAKEGVRCTEFYVAAPSCSPSRGALLTGRHPRRNGLNYQLKPQENINGFGLPLSERILPQYLKPLGYTCGMFGKWNIGFGAGVRPTERGFDEFLGHASGNIHYYKHLYHKQNDLRKGTEPVNMRGQYATDLFANAAIDFIHRNQNRPWFVYLPFNAVHFVSSINVESGEKIEWQVPAKYLAMYGCPPDEPDERLRFRAVLTALDDAIGRVLRTIDNTGLWNRTVVLLISDNGAFMLKGRGLEVQSNKPLREGGVTLYEGGVRVPAMVRWPGRIKPGTLCHEMLSSLDVLPMLVTAAGGVLPDDRVFDGRNPIPVLAAEARSPHKAFHWTWDQYPNQHWQAMREGQYKIVRRTDKDPWQLYDLSNDIGESNDLSTKRPELTRRLAGSLDRWIDSVSNDPTRSISLRK